MNEISAIRLQEARKKNNLNLRELEQLTGISRSTLSRYEKIGLLNAPLDKIKSLCSALSVDENWILGKLPSDKQFIEDLSLNLENMLVDDENVDALEIYTLITYTRNEQEKKVMNEYIETKKKLLNYKGLKELKYYIDYLTTRNDLVSDDLVDYLNQYKGIIGNMIISSNFDINDFISKMEATLERKYSNQNSPSKED